MERGLAETSARAKALIMAGLVFLGEQRVDKPGQQIALEAQITVRGNDNPWVSRGGLKLAYALEYFDISTDVAVALDVGASTGGFTDVLIQRGARMVYAVDVGRGQLDWKLQTDVRVVQLDKTNARYLTSEIIPDQVNLISCDASFISLKTVLPAALKLVAPSAMLIALIKPQFEVERSHVNKGGVVKDPYFHREVCKDIKYWLSEIPGWKVWGVTESPIQGAEGNREFFIAGQYIA